MFLHAWTHVCKIQVSLESGEHASHVWRIKSDRSMHKCHIILHKQSHLFCKFYGIRGTCRSCPSIQCDQSMQTTMHAQFILACTNRFIWWIWSCMKDRGIAQPQTWPSPTSHLSIQANSEYLILRRLARMGWALLSPRSTLLLSTTQVSHLLLSQHKNCSYWAPIRVIDPKFFELCRYDPNLKLEPV